MTPSTSREEAIQALIPEIQSIRSSQANSGWMIEEDLEAIFGAEEALAYLLAENEKLRARIDKALAIWERADERVKARTDQGGVFSNQQAFAPLMDAADNMRAALTDEGME